MRTFDVSSHADIRASSAVEGGHRPQPLRVLFSSPIGPLGIEVRGSVVTSLKIDPTPEEERTFQRLKEAECSDFLDEAVGRILEYLAGARQSLEVDYDLHLEELSAFPYRVLVETAKIAYGARRSYQNVATSAGQPESYRLVRSVLLANPLPLLVPCHRVVPHKGGIGGYVAGEERKEWLLRLESETVAQHNKASEEAE